ncbi:MAG: bifunctional DNA-formamidopyrimidine glycosylase/DNA-(apurinic or apyrimidinic site) lyase [Candidatus Berkiella sp.]
MPELPEVQTVCQGIEPFIVGKVINNVIVREKRLRWPVPSTLAKFVNKQPVLKVTRRAKYILIHLPKGILIIHLGMSGTLKITNASSALQKHDHLDWVFNQDLILRFNDPRRFGCVLIADDGLPSMLAKLGPEPLEKTFSAAYLFQKAQNHRSAVKTFIMNQRIVVGVGNIYASEALFAAQIHPGQMANTLSLAQYQRLVKAIKCVLTCAIKKGGTTLKDFRQSDGKPGYFSQALTVYGRKGEPCIACQTPIKSLRLGQRATYYCPSCQTCP